MANPGIPFRYKETFTDTYDSRILLYNPSSTIGPQLMTQELYYVLSLIDGKRTHEEILHKLNRSGAHFSLPDLDRILLFFRKNELIYYHHPETHHSIDFHQPKTIHVWFHITNQCNLNCSYCFVNKTPEEMGTATIEASISNIFSSGKRNGFNHVHIAFSGGEPLLKFKDILKAARLARQLGKEYGMEVTLNAISNGVLLTKQAALALKELDTKIAISLDGLGEFQDATRPFKNKGGTFDYAMKGILNAVDAGILSHVNITVTKHNISHLPDYVSYLLKNKLPFVLQYYSDTPLAKEKLKASDEDLIKYLRKTISIIRKDLPPYRIVDHLSCNVSFSNPRYGCGAANGSYLIVRHDGKIAGCNFNLEQSIGTVNDDNLATVPKRKGYIKSILSRKGKTECSACRWRFICSACPLQLPEGAKTPAYCRVNKVVIPELIKLEAARLLKYGPPNKRV